MTSVADVVSLGKQQVVMRARDVTRSLEPSFFVPGVLKSFKDNRVLAEVGEGNVGQVRDLFLLLNARFRHQRWSRALGATGCSLRLCSVRNTEFHESSNGKLRSKSMLWIRVASPCAPAACRVSRVPPGAHDCGSVHA